MELTLHAPAKVNLTLIVGARRDDGYHDVSTVMQTVGFPEKRKDGSWIKKIVFNFPVPVDGEEVKELPLETETTVETVVLLSQLK